MFFFFSSRRRHTRYWRDWSSDVCSSDLGAILVIENERLLAVHMPDDGVPVADFFGQQAGGFGDTILIATRNEGKTKEFRRLFGDMGYRVENLNDYPELPDVAETGVTFEIGRAHV